MFGLSKQEKQFQEEFEAYFAQWEATGSRAALELAWAVAQDSLRGGAQRQAAQRLYDSEVAYHQGQFIVGLLAESRKRRGR